MMNEKCTLAKGVSAPSVTASVRDKRDVKHANCPA